MKEFLDYYYTEKTKDNEIYVIETDHDIRAMMQLNPYVIQMGKKAVESRYIVAVATEPLYRHRGYMAELLSKTARDLYQQKMPFFFLMPASEKIYYPHNYRFIYATDVWNAIGADGEELTIQKIVELQNDSGVTLRKAEEKDCKKLGDFAEEYWHYDSITKKSEEQFIESYQKWAKEKGYHQSQDKAAKIYMLAKEGIPTVSSDTPSTKMLVQEAVRVLREINNTLMTILTQMQALAKSLPEYPVVTKNEILNSTVRLCGGIYSNTVDIYYFI